MLNFSLFFYNFYKKERTHISNIELNVHLEEWFKKKKKKTIKLNMNMHRFDERENSEGKLRMN